MKSGIEWTQERWNPAAGCTRVSPGCANCYAEHMMRRFQHNPMEIGDQNVSLKTIQTLCNRLKCDIADLFPPERAK